MEKVNNLRVKQITLAPIGNHYFNVAMSIVGMVIIICGTLLTDLSMQKSCYLGGGFLMLISAALERQKFFVILQSIISLGALVAFTSLPSVFKAAIPLLLSVVAIVYMRKQKLLQDGVSFVGCIGLILLAAGYAITHPIIYWLGAIVLMGYSFIAYRRGVTIGLLWGILNAIFAVTASVAVYRLFI